MDELLKGKLLTSMKISQLNFKIKMGKIQNIGENFDDFSKIHCLHSNPGTTKSNHRSTFRTLRYFQKKKRINAQLTSRKLGIHNAAERMNDYPHQLVVDKRQRITDAMVCNPYYLLLRMSQRR